MRTKCFWLLMSATLLGCSSPADPAASTSAAGGEGGSVPGAATSSMASTSTGVGGGGGASSASGVGVMSSSTGASSGGGVPATGSSASSGTGAGGPSASSGAGAGGSTARCDPQGAFSAPTLATELHPGPALQDEAGGPWLTDDELVVYFDLAGVYVAERASRGSSFGAPTQLNLETSGDFLSHPSLSPDGLTIFYDDLQLQTGALLPHAAHRATLTDPFGPGAPVTVSTDVAFEYRQTAHGFYYLGHDDNDYDQLLFDDGNGGPTAVVFAFTTSERFHSYALAADELSAYVTGTDGLDVTETYRVTRASLGEPFGSAEVVDPISVGSGPGSDNFQVTWVSQDGCVVYGEYFDNGPDDTYVYRATRAQ